MQNSSVSTSPRRRCPGWRFETSFHGANPVYFFSSSLNLTDTISAGISGAVLAGRGLDYGVHRAWPTWLRQRKPGKGFVRTYRARGNSDCGTMCAARLHPTTATSTFKHLTMKLQDLYSIVTNLQAQGWHLNMANQCLPVSLDTLPLLPNANARVVIGTVSFKGEMSGVAGHLLDYVKASCVDYNPPYHAWIEFGANDILDMTLGSTYRNQYPNVDNRAFDRRLANRLGIQYQAVITDPVEVNLFFARIMSPDAPGFNQTVPSFARPQQAAAPTRKASATNGWRRFVRRRCAFALVVLHIRVNPGLRSVLYGRSRQ